MPETSSYCNIISIKDIKFSIISGLSNEVKPSTPMHKKSLQNKLYIQFFTIGLFALLSIGFYGVSTGDPLKFLYDYDSWGNICGKKNNPLIPGANLSGMDHSNRTFVLHMGVNNIRAALKPVTYKKSSHKPAVICIHECPTAKLTDCGNLLKDNGYTSLNNSFVDENICTMLFHIILPQITDFNRCIPIQVLQVIQIICVCVCVCVFVCVCVCVCVCV